MYDKKKNPNFSDNDFSEWRTPHAEYYGLGLG